MTDIVELALAYYHRPLDYQNCRSLATPLPTGMDRLLWLANGSPEAIAAGIDQTGVRAEELRDAARFCIQQWCFARGADPYRVLGVQPGATPEQIKEHHRLLMRLFHPDRVGGSDETWTDQYASRINEAWTALSRSPDHPAASDSQFYPRATPVQDIVCLTTEYPITPVATPTVSRPRSKPRALVRRRRLLLQLLVWGGAVLAIVAILGGLCLSHWSVGPGGRPSTGVAAIDPPSSVSVAAMPDPPAVPPTVDQGPFSPFLTAPDWQALAQREQQAQQQAIQLHEQQLQLEQSRQRQIVAEEAMLAAMREERARLEQQIKAEQLRMQQVQAERLAAEQRRLAQLQLEQSRVEQVQTEREQRVRERLEALQVERVQAERLAEDARLERKRLERSKIEQAQAERQQLEQQQAKRLQAEAAESAAPAMPLPVVVATEANALTTGEVENLMSRYMEAYQRGDLNGVMALFTAGARGRIQSDYAALFAKYVVRGLWLRDLHWAFQGSSSANGAGRYELKLRQRDNGQLRQVAGSIRFTVQKYDKRLLIEAIDYDWPEQ